MGKLHKDYPPYQGSEPYIFFCFSPEDGQRVRPLLARMSRRGCRIWYPAGKVETKREFDAESARMAGASLVIGYLTERFCDDTSAKGNLKDCYGRRQPILLFRADPLESNLPLGLPEELVSVQDEEELIRAEGFHAGLIGEPPKKRYLLLKALAAAMLLGALGVTGLTGWQRQVTELSLRELPESAETLERYPALERISVPQSLGEAALALFGGEYVIVLREG